MSYVHNTAANKILLQLQRVTAAQPQSKSCHHLHSFVQVELYQLFDHSVIHSISLMSFVPVYDGIFYSIDSACKILRLRHGSRLLRYASLLDLSSSQLTNCDDSWMKHDEAGIFAIGEGPRTLETRMSITAHP